MILTWVSKSLWLDTIARLHRISFNCYGISNPWGDFWLFSHFSEKSGRKASWTWNSSLEGVQEDKDGEGMVDREKLVERGSRKGRRERKRDLKGCRCRCEGIWGGRGERWMVQRSVASVRSSTYACYPRACDCFSICLYALINTMKGNYPTTCRECVGMFSLRVFLRVGVLVTPDLRFTSKLYRRLPREKNAFSSFLYFPSWVFNSY